ncbi:hypothetical protein LCGC14_0806180, partial [marine sediment metagenome]
MEEEIKVCNQRESKYTNGCGGS